MSKAKGSNARKIGLICEALKQAVKQCEQNAISISIMNGDNKLSETNGNRLDPSFMYTQIMKDAKLIIKLGFFFIVKSNDYIENNSVVTVVTRALLSIVDMEAFKKMHANKGGLLSFNSFLSTSANRSVSVDFAERALTDSHTIFRIGEMTLLGSNIRLVQVQLSLASDKDNDLCRLTVLFDR